VNGLFDTSAELELARRLSATGRDPGEADRLARLVLRFLILPSPPNGATHFPRYGELQRTLETAVLGGTGEAIEDAFLELYAHLHMNEAPYTSDERRQMDEAGGYWNHAGGLSPILKAERWINEDTVSADFGAGNGLQAFLLQVLYPHAKTVQIEISSKMRDIGEGLREWLGIAGDRVDWIIDDVLNVSANATSDSQARSKVRTNRRSSFRSRIACAISSPNATRSSTPTATSPASNPPRGGAFPDTSQGGHRNFRFGSGDGQMTRPRA
jgi:hypothetical protein